MGNITLVDKFLNEFSEIGKRISREDIDKVIDILIETWKKGNKIFIIGNDNRGMLFGVGYFLRKISMHPDKILVPNDRSNFGNIDIDYLFIICVKVSFHW